MLLLALLFASVVAEWPPSLCDPGVNVEGVSRTLTSSLASQHQVASCSLTENFESVFYMQATRKYGPNSGATGDSKMILALNDLFDVNIHNDRITIDESSNQCFFPMVSSSPSSFWIRVRLHAMNDIRKTFVAISLIPIDGGDTFIECAKMELEGIVKTFTLTLSAETHTAMEQTIHSISKHRYEKNPNEDASIMEARLARLEERVRRLHNVVTEYIGSHETLVQSISDNHMSLKSSIVETHNKIKSNSTTHSMIGFFMFFLLLICGIFYIRWRSNEYKRFRMP